MGFDNNKLNYDSNKNEMISNTKVGSKISNTLKGIFVKRLTKKDIEEIRIDSYTYTY